MSYEHDRSQSKTRGAGKASLTEGMTGGAAQRNIHMANPGKTTLTGARTRDVEAAPMDSGVEASPDPRITKPAPGGGPDVAATMVGATADTEPALDGAFTPALVTALQANPDVSIDEVLQHLAGESLRWVRGGGLQHPTIVQYGQTVQGSSKGGSTKKHAVLIANQSYEYLPDLGAPLADATGMQGALASRGYDVNLHTDKTATDMSALWGSMVGSAKQGDDLVAHYGGHGVPEGLAGINHGRPPRPPDLFTNAQVSGVMSSATSKGAHLRFVLDSCHSGSAVQTVREERENELAAAAGSFGDKLRVAALTGLRETKERLVALRQRRAAMPRELGEAIQHHQSRAPDPTDTEATAAWNKTLKALRDVEAAGPDAFDRIEDRIWAECVPLLDLVRMMARYAAAPPPLSDYATLAPQLNYLDDLWNAVSLPMEQATAKAGAAETR